MKKFTALSTIVTLFAFAGISYGQIVAPNLGTAANFALFSGTGAVTNTGASMIKGDVGTRTGALTGFGGLSGGPGTVDGNIRFEASPESIQAAIDVNAAYNALLALPCNRTIGAELAGQTLTAGVSCQNTATATSLNGTLTLSGPGVFIIKLNSALTTGTSASVVLTNGATADKVFFQVNGAATLNTGTSFKGTIIAGGAIVLNSTTLEGRALATVGAITNNSSNVNVTIAPNVGIPDLTPTIILPQANFTAAAPNSIRNFTVELQELKGHPTSSGSVIFTITAPFGYVIAFDAARTTIDVSGGATTLVENTRWNFTAPSGGQLQLTMKAGQFIAANATATLGFTIARTIANPGASANITVGITDNASQVYDSEPANNIFARVVNALFN